MNEEKKVYASGLRVMLGLYIGISVLRSAKEKKKEFKTEKRRAGNNSFFFAVRLKLVIYEGMCVCVCLLEMT